MAKVTGPLFSMSARGTVGDALTYATWKGIPYCREYFIPSNPQTVKQVNVRTAFTLSMAKWHELPQGQKDAYDTGAEGTGQSGISLAMGRMMDAYVSQLTVDVTPLSLTNVGNYPADVITWLPVV